MSTSSELNRKIYHMEKQLDETEEGLAHDRGPTRDVMKLVIPMMRDQLQLMRDIVNRE